MLLRAAKPIIVVLTAFGAVLLNVINYAQAFFASIVGTASSFLSYIFEIMYALRELNFDKVAQKFNAMTEDLKHKWELFTRGIGNIFAKIWNNIVSSIENALNKIINSINKVAKSLKMATIPNVDFSGAKIPTYATGGFPQENGLFIPNTFPYLDALLRSLLKT